MEHVVVVRKVTPRAARQLIERPFSCYVGMSMGSLNFRGRRLESIVKWVSERAEQGVFVLGDTLHRFNLMAQYGLAEADAIRMANCLGQEMLTAESATLSLLNPEQFAVRRWQSILDEPSFPGLRNAVDSWLNSEPALLRALTGDASSYVARTARRGVRYAVETARAVELAEAYLREEIAAFAFLAGSGLAVDVYPGPELTVLERAMRHTGGVAMPEQLSIRLNIELSMLEPG